MKPVFISIQATYANVHLALFKKDVCVARTSKSETRASSHLILFVEEMLSANHLRLADLDFIAIDKGPGAFTSLRVAVATINGIAFAHRIPLIGIDSLNALIYDVSEKVKSKQIPSLDFILALLNAYNNDVYYALAQFDDFTKHYEIRSNGCNKIDTVLALIQKDYVPRKIIGTGNGCAQHYDLIKDAFDDEVQIYHHQQATPTAEGIGALGLEQFLSEQTHTYKIEPHYLKSQYFALTSHSTKRS
jgi:tRNA threonylcarbamoyladenosine biosynthesis protein TsaB